MASDLPGSAKSNDSQTVASKEPRQRRGGAKPLQPPRIKSHALWGWLPAEPTKHNPQLALAGS